MTGESRPVLVTGATGYIGGRLVPRLLASGRRVRCLARSPRKLAGRPWAGDAGVEIVEGDAADLGSLTRAMEGCGPAFYLVHSMMAAGTDYAARDRLLAQRFAEAAESAGLSRIVYLGGLGELGGGRSRLSQTARFLPRGLAGLAYWYALLPVHGVVFRSMLDGIRRAALTRGAASVSPP